MNDAQQWFLLSLVWAAESAALVAGLVAPDWFSRPPLSWITAANHRLADRLVRPWLEPLLRWWGPG